MQSLFIRSMSIDWDAIPSSSYLRKIPALSGLEQLEFSCPITIFSGENGTGKSTILEALAVASGFNAEGGTFSYDFSTYDDVSALAEAASLVRGFRRPRVGCFLRAESFFNVASAALTEYNYDGQMEDWHAESHGESFLSFLTKYEQPGLFIMDEPEAALSPRRQISLIEHIAEKAQEGSQFVVATHSPIILGVEGAQILSFDRGRIEPCAYGDTDSVQVMRQFLLERGVG